MIKDTSEPQSQLRRLFVRSEIAKQIAQPNQKGFEAIRNKVRQALESKFQPALESVQNKEFEIDPRLEVLAVECQKALELEFPDFKNLAMIVLGSGQLPSRRIKQLFNDQVHISDLDWGVAYDFNALDETQRRQEHSRMVDLVNSVLMKTGKSVGLDGIQSCKTLNPQYEPKLRHKQEVYTFNLPDHSSALNYLISRKGNFELFDPVFLYFVPSIPPDVNQKNQEVFLEALSSLSTSDYGLYTKTVNALTIGWRVIRDVDVKHFANDHIDYSEYSPKNGPIIRNFNFRGQRKNDFLTHHFMEKLRKTDKTKPTA